MNHALDLDRRFRTRLRNERIWLFRKAATTLRKGEPNPYSRGAVAKQIGTACSTFQGWENGQGKPSLDQWDSWCVAVRQDFAAVLTELFLNAPD